MRSPRFSLLLAKEARELLASRAYWLLLLAAGILAGHSAVTAFDTYAEMSGAGGGPSALRQGLNPLDGIVIPLAGTLSLVATLLLPFVVIRQVGHERTTGAWKLMAQGPARTGSIVAAKVIVLLGGFCVAWIPTLTALGLWRAAGNHLDGPETLGVGLAQLLFGWLIIGVGAAAAAMTSQEATAAIIALGFTIGGWALELMASLKGGFFAELAGFSPSTVLRTIEQGLLTPGLLLALLGVGGAGIWLAELWLRPGLTLTRRISGSLVAGCLALVVIAAGSRIHWYGDLSEDRRNSFSRADQVALASIPGQLDIAVHLAPEDPRITDLQRGVLGKLQRTMPRVSVTNVAGSRTGLFERDENYGLIRYDYQGRSVSSRATTPEIVLENIYQLAGQPVPAREDPGYPGYPLITRPRHTGLFLFGVWPLVLGLGYWWSRREPARPNP